MARSIQLFVSAVLLATAATAASAADVVISQVYGSGGNSGSVHNYDYIELLNKGSSDIDLSTYSVQYGSSTSTGNWSGVTKLSGTVQAGHYFLIQEQSNITSSPVSDLPTPDLVATTTTGIFNASGSNGKIALVNGQTAINGACPGSNVIDFVGYGSANCSEGSTTGATAAPAQTVTTASLRANDGCTDTDINNADFTSTTPNPRNSSSTKTCSGGNTPTNPGASGTASPNTVGSNGSTLLTIHVTAGTNPTSIFTLDGSTSAKVQANLASIGGANPQAFACGAPDLSGNLTCTFTATVTGTTGSKLLPITVIDDQGRSAAAANISLTVVSSASIMDIQGHGMTSPFAGTVTQVGSTNLGAKLLTPKDASDSTHWNIVTVINPGKGFFMQDATGDNDTTTSDGIYVYTGSAPKYSNGTVIAVGDAVQVVGAVQEYNGSTEFGGTLTITQLGTGAVPAAFDLSANPPTDDNATGVCMGVGSTIHPVTDSFQASNFACLDGMLVSFSNATVAAATGGGGGGGNAPDAPQYFYATLSPQRQFRTAGIEPGDPGYANFGGAGLNLPVYSGDPDIFEVYFNSLGVSAGDLPNGGIYSVGQQVSVSAAVVQGFQFTDSDNSYAPTSPIFYELYPLSVTSVTVSGTGLTLPQSVPDPVSGTLTIGSQNGLHFFNDQNDGQDSTAYFDACLATAQQVAGNLSGLNTPLALGDNDTCPTHDQYETRLSKMSLQIRTVLKAPVIQALQEVESLAVLSDIADKIHADQLIVDGSDLTYHSYLFTGNDPQGINIGILAKDGVTVNSVTQLAKNSTTNACSGGGTCLLNDRPPVLLDAVYNGYPFRVLAIYDRSLGSMSEKAYVGLKRRAQAEQLAQIVQVLQTDNGTLVSDEGCSAQVDGSGTSTNCTIAITGSSAIPLAMLGDFNAYEFSDGFTDVVGTIMGTVDTDPSHSIYPPTVNYVAPSPTLVNTVEPTLDPATNPLDWNPNYSYSFDGLSEELDHILLTRSGWRDFVHVSHSHGNSDVSSAGPDVSDATTARRLSDHDGQVVTIALDRIFADGVEVQP